MATYTLIESVSQCHAMVGDGVGNLYVAAFLSGTPIIKIYQYEIATDTLTDISGNTFNGYIYGSGDRGNLTWWSNNSKLYMVCGTGPPPAASTVYCFRWDGGQNWTQVDSQTWANVGTLNPVIKSSPDRLAYKYQSTNGNVRGTADGSTWNTDITAHTILSLYHDVSQYDDLLCEYYESGGPSTKVYRNTSGSTWAALSGSDIGVTQDFLGTNDTYSFFRARTGTNWVSRSTDWGVTRNNIADLDLHDRPPSVFDLTHEVVALLSTGGGGQDQVRFWNSGTLTFDLDGTPNSNDFVDEEPCYFAGYLYVLVRNDGIYKRDNPIGPITAVDFDVSPKYEARGMDVSADDLWLYVAVLESTNPVLLKLNSNLSADPTRAFNPGSGDAIAVVAGRQTDEGVWISGRFDGTNKVELSDDYGATWTVEDPATWAGRAYPPLIGPDDDGRMIIATDQDDDLHETTDAGTAWEERNTSLPFDVGDMDHLDTSPDELVIGSNVAAADRVEYSPNRGRSFEDISAASENFETTQIIVG